MPREVRPQARYPRNLTSVPFCLLPKRNCRSHKFALKTSMGYVASIEAWEFTTVVLPGVTLTKQTIWLHIAILPFNIHT